MKDLKPASELAQLRSRALPGETAAYTTARKALLAQEIELRRLATSVAEQRQALPQGPVVEKDYRFIDETGNNVGLIDLFGDHDSLVVYFWMFGPERDRPCPMCTNWIGGVDGNAADIRQRTAYKVASRSPVARMQDFAAERGWRNTEFVQTVGDAFIADLAGLDGSDGYDVPALAVYQRDGDRVRYFYIGEMPAGAADPGQDPRTIDIPPLWNILDLTPEGRGTDWYPKLSYGKDAP